MATIAGFAKLRSLTVSDAPITDAGVARVAELSRLRCLMLLNLPLTDASADPLVKAHGSRRVKLGRSEHNRRRDRFAGAAEAP